MLAVNKYLIFKPSSDRGKKVSSEGFLNVTYYSENGESSSSGSISTKYFPYL